MVGPVKGLMQDSPPWVADRRTVSCNADREAADYYLRLPRRGQTVSNPYGLPETVVWTVRGSVNYQQCDRDITASVAVRNDGAIVPWIRNGRGDSLTSLIMVCEPGTRPAVAIRRLISEARRYNDAWDSLIRGAGRA